MERASDELQQRLQSLDAAFRESQQQLESLLEAPKPALALPELIDCGALATGTCAHAEGEATLASGEAAHAEGSATEARGNFSHAEGGGTIADGSFSHAEGALSTDAVGQASHAEGLNSRSEGDFSHAEGGATTAFGDSSHAEGANSRAVQGASHAEGSGSLAQGPASHAEGSKTTAAGSASHAEGDGAQTLGWAAHAEGARTRATANWAHAEGIATEVTGQAAHSEGFLALARGFASHAEGIQTDASGTGSHAEGTRTDSSGDFSHAEGDGTSTGGLPGAHIMGKSGTAHAPWSWFLANGLGGGFGIAAAIYSSGIGVADRGWFTGIAGDYAELFETVDGDAIDCGYFVTLDGEKVRKAEAGDDFIVGVTSATPAFVGDSGHLRWKHKFVTDGWGRIQYQEVAIPAQKSEEGEVIVEERTDVEPVLNPEFDAEREYLSRMDRPEWVPVALMGKVLVRDDGTCEVNSYCASNGEGIATSSTDGFRVMRRTGSNQILILMR
jgi:trimeric autotransporter adhesin